MPKKILILCNSNPNTDPRPNRMIHYLKDKYQVTVVGQNEACIDGVQSIGFFYTSREKPEQQRLFAETQERMRANPLGQFLVTTARTLMRWITRLVYLPINFLKKIRRMVRLILKHYEAIVWSELGHVRAVEGKLAAENYDLIISHDVTLLPLVSKIVTNKKTKVMLDAREFYPRNFDDQWKWRLEVKPVNEYLCEQYLSKCDKVITVSNGLSQEYKRVYKVDPEVIMSLPVSQNLAPVAVKGDRIRIIHHGYASYSRRTEVMIEMMDYIDERFSLDLMLLVGSGSYWEKIVSMVKERKNVNLISPVPMGQIVPFTNQYDIGLFLCPPTNFNLTYALPNKFFEFIQARLAIAIGPSIEMKEIVEKYDCGIISADFRPQTLASELSKLTADKLMYYKNQSHEAASILNAHTNGKRIHEIVSELVN